MVGQVPTLIGKKPEKLIWLASFLLFVFASACQVYFHFKSNSTFNSIFNSNSNSKSNSVCMYYVFIYTVVFKGVPAFTRSTQLRAYQNFPNFFSGNHIEEILRLSPAVFVLVVIFLLIETLRSTLTL